MAARRKVRSRSKSPVVDVKTGEPVVDAVKVPKEQRLEDFFPPSFSHEALPPVKDSDLVTYFIEADKRGFRLYEPHAVKYLHSGFRAVIVGPPTFTFDKPVAKLVGRVRGDHFQKAAEWAKSNIVLDWHNRFKVAGGGTPHDREKAVKRYMRAKQAIIDYEKKKLTVEQEFEAAGIGLLERFGKSPLVIEGETYDPSYTREKVFWKKRLER